MIMLFNSLICLLFSSLTPLLDPSPLFSLSISLFHSLPSSLILPTPFLCIPLSHPFLLLPTHPHYPHTFLRLIPLLSFNALSSSHAYFSLFTPFLSSSLLIFSPSLPSILTLIFSSSLPVLRYSDNALGHGGRLAQVYGTLMKEMWSDGYTKVRTSWRVHSHTT